jgi:polyhydroxyalkanoate synthesis regulator phasin
VRNETLKALAKELRSQVQEGALTKDEAEMIISEISEQAKEVYGPSEQQLEEVRQKRDIAAEQVKAVAKQYSQYGKIEDIKNINTAIDALPNVSDQAFMSRYETIRGELVSKQSMLGVEASDALKRKLESVKDEHQLKVGMRVEAERAASKQERLQKMIAARAGKIRRFKLPPPGTKEREDAIKNLLMRYKALRRLRK